MRTTACDDVCALIDREAIGWTEAERLRVEQHLAECPSCSEVLSLSRFVRDTLREAAGELSDTGRMRAIKGALAQGGRRSLGSAPKRLPLWSIGAGAAAAAAALVIWFARAPDADTKNAARVDHAAEDAAVARADEAAPSPDAPALSPRVVESQGRETHTFAHATAELAPGTRARFEPAAHTLWLERGAVDVDVDPAKHAPFFVATARFRVEVLGTRFSVTPDTVRVEHGRVRVVSPTGVVLASELGAGQSYQLPERTSAKPSKASAPSKSASALLAEARGALGRAELPAAKELIRAAESARPARRERAEAGTLRAEVALLERDSAAAMRAYGEVARRYPELPAGENAAFAAAQLALKSEPAKARGLLDAYLARYPRGRFADEAKERLRRLGAR